ncbi:MAG: chloride channel protein [Actinobacteria bacterium]|nr:chloride channel protein [Actinomycetota bacterium]
MTFRVPAYSLDDPRQLLLFALLGLVAVGLSLLFIEGLDRWVAALGKLAPWSRPILFGLIVASVGFWFPEVLGSGQSFIEGVLQEEIQRTWWIFGLLALAKVLATSLTLGGKGSGGIFMPSLFIGATAGAAFRRADLVRLAGFEHRSRRIRSGRHGGRLCRSRQGSTHIDPHRLRIDRRLRPRDTAHAGRGNQHVCLQPTASGERLHVAAAPHGDPHRAYGSRRSARHCDGGKPGAPDPGDSASRGHARGSTGCAEPGEVAWRAGYGRRQAGRRGDRVGHPSRRRTVRPGLGQGRDDPRSDHGTGQLPVSETLERMATLGVGRLPVVAEKDPHRLVAMFRREDAIAAYHLALGSAARRDRLPERVRTRRSDSTRFFDIEITDNSPANGRKIKEVPWPEGCLVVSIHRGNDLLVASGDEELRSGDALTVFGDEQARHRLSQRLRADL